MIKIKCVFAMVSALLFSAQVNAAETKKPLKVFILAGQSNMLGHVLVRTFEGVAMDPKTKPMYDEMCDADGKPRVSKDVYISHLSEIGKWGQADRAEVSGPLTVGFGALGGETKIGPEFTFGLYMHKLLKEPILIIKTAWGGRSLHSDFRPPSAGPYDWVRKVPTEEQKQKKIKDTGVFYRLMIEHVKKVLADPGSVHPAYDKSAGYELAGFVWFQGYNDLVSSWAYPDRNQPGGYDAYSDTFGHLIRDVRKELSAPKMPFLIGVLGVGGPVTAESEAASSPRYRGIAAAFRSGMAKPASMPEFKGSVIAVETDPFWDMELDRIVKLRGKAKRDAKQEAKEKGLNGKQRAALAEKHIGKTLTPKEIEYLEKNVSNQGFHYHGSAKIMGSIGKAFAEALAEWHGKNE
jgi:hypothetical protein